MTCTYNTPSDTPCGKPAVAAWEHDILGLSFLCADHDRKARRACAVDPDLLLAWDRLPIAPQSVQEDRSGSTETVAA